MMRYFLLVVNTKHNEIHADKEFTNMSELEDYVITNYVNWTSMVVTVLPLQGKTVIKD